MSKDRIYSIDDVTQFCEVTGDRNPLHKAEFMAERGKYPIVPGMLVWTQVASLAPDFLRAPAHAQVYFQGVVHPEETLRYEVTADGEYQVLRANTNLLRKENPSRIDHGLYDLQVNANREVTVPFDSMKAKAFAGLLETENEVTSLLYSIALTPTALYSVMSNPLGDGEKEVLHNLGGRLPMFTELDFYTTGHLPKQGDLNFGVEMEAKRNQLTFRLSCTQGAPIYTAYLKARPRHTDILVAIAKDLPKPIADPVPGQGSEVAESATA